MKILVDSDLRDHPKLVRLAQSLRVSRVAAAGHLVFLWLWTAVHRPSGDLSELTADDLAEVVGWKGDAKRLSTALRDCGWIDDGKPPQVHDWIEHERNFMERRAKDKERKRAERARLSAGRPPDTETPSAGRPSDVHVTGGADCPNLSEPPFPCPCPSPVPCPSPTATTEQHPGGAPVSTPSRKTETTTANTRGDNRPPPAVSSVHDQLAKEYVSAGGVDLQQTAARHFRAAILRGVSAEALQRVIHNPAHGSRFAWAIVSITETGRVPGDRDAPVDTEAAVNAGIASLTPEERKRRGLEILTHAADSKKLPYGKDGPP